MPAFHVLKENSLPWSVAPHRLPEIVQATAPAEHPLPLDLHDLAERCLGSFELVERLLNSFEQRFWPEVEQLERALAAGNAELAARVVHTLKGATANVSAERLRRVVAQIENVLRSGSLEDLRAPLEQLRHEWEQFNKAVSYQRSAISRQLLADSQ